MDKVKKQYHHGDLPSALMDAAVKRIASDGIDKLSLRAIARDIGVSQTAPYRHFNGKDQLLAAIAQQGFEQLTAVTSVGCDPDHVLEGLCHIGRSYVRFAQDHPEQYKLMFGPSIADRQSHPELMLTARTAFEVILKQCQWGVEQGHFIDQDPRALAHGCWNRVHGFASLLIDGFYDLSVEHLDHFLDHMLWLNLRGLCNDQQAVEQLKPSKANYFREDSPLHPHCF